MSIPETGEEAYLRYWAERGADPTPVPGIRARRPRNSVITRVEEYAILKYEADEG